MTGHSGSAKADPARHDRPCLELVISKECFHGRAQPNGKESRERRPRKFTGKGHSRKDRHLRQTVIREKYTRIARAVISRRVVACLNWASRQCGRVATLYRFNEEPSSAGRVILTITAVYVVVEFMG